MFLLLLTIFVAFIGANDATPKVSNVKCLTPMYKCWVDFTDETKPNADARITIHYDFMTGEETQFNAKISNLAEVTPFENFDYREDFEITYDIADHEMYKYEKKRHDVHLMSETLTPLQFERGIYVIKSNKFRVSSITTCPIFIFRGIRYGVKFCIEIDIKKDVVEMRGGNSYLMKLERNDVINEVKS